MVRRFRPKKAVSYIPQDHTLLLSYRVENTLLNLPLRRLMHDAAYINNRLSLI